MPVEIKTFPQTRDQALALEYVRTQDLSGLSPTQILEMYETAYAEIREAYKKRHPAITPR